MVVNRLLKLTHGAVDLDGTPSDSVDDNRLGVTMTKIIQSARLSLSFRSLMSRPCATWSPRAKPLDQCTATTSTR